jgi:hypothetical protein
MLIQQNQCTKMLDFVISDYAATLSYHVRLIAHNKTCL